MPSSRYRWRVRVMKFVENERGIMMTNMIKRSMLVVALAGLMSGPANAGEITGTGKILPVNGKSECAFSGLNDTPDGDIPTGDPGGRVQSYGYFFGFVLRDAVPRPEKDGNMSFLHPGNACNPS